MDREANTTDMAYLHDKPGTDPKETEREFERIMSGVAEALDNPEEFAKRANASPLPSDADKLAAARQAYVEMDEFLALLPNATAAQRLNVEAATHRVHGPRPTPLTAAELVEQQRLAAKMASEEMKAELEFNNKRMLEELGYSSIEAMHRGDREVPSLIVTSDQLRGYQMPDGRIVPEYQVSDFGPTVIKNVEFDQIAARVAKMTNAHH